MIPLSKDTIEFVRYYENILIKFYHEHYFLLIAIILAVCMTIFLIPFGFAVYRAEKELAEERKAREKETAKAKAHKSSEGKQSGGKSRSNKGVKLATMKKTTLPPHPLLAAEFKGHTGFICSLDFDVNGKYLASCSSDRTIRLWHMKSMSDKDHKYTRKNIDLDHASHLRFSPDGTAVVGSLAVANTIAVYRVAKHKSGLVLNDTEVVFPKCSGEVISLDMASNGRYIMSCTDKQFTIWTLKGEELAEVPTNQTPNTCAVVSPCGKFVATAGFTSDVKLWEVGFNKSGEFTEVTRAMELSGHRASVLSISFSRDSKRAATVSKDRTWRFWEVDVRYTLNESPRELKSVSLSDDKGNYLIALSPDARVAAISSHTSLFLYLTATGELTHTLTDVHRDSISALCWEQSSRYLASGGGEDRHVRLWHNTPGLAAMATDLEEKITKASSAAFQERLKQELADVRQQLKRAGAM